MALLIHLLNSSFIILWLPQGNWTRFYTLPQQARTNLLTSPDWTHIFFWRNVLERFVSGYLDKVVTECDYEGKKPLTIDFYKPFGFSCQKHRDLEDFISFMETVPTVEGHFHAQTPLCSIGTYPFTDMVKVDSTLSDYFKSLSKKYGVEHPLEEWKATRHKTNAESKMVELFKDKPHLIQRILNMFPEDCEKLPSSACNVDNLMSAIEKANNGGN